MQQKKRCKRRTPSETALPRCRRLVPPCYAPEEEEEKEEEEGLLTSNE